MRPKPQLKPWLIAETDTEEDVYLLSSIAIISQAHLPPRYSIIERVNVAHVFDTEKIEEMNGITS